MEFGHKYNVSKRAAVPDQYESDVEVDIEFICDSEISNGDITNHGRARGD
jgi:hypothetical protein